MPGFRYWQTVGFRLHCLELFREPITDYGKQMLGAEGYTEYFTSNFCLRYMFADTQNLTPETDWMAPEDQKLMPAKDYEETPDND